MDPRRRRFIEYRRDLKSRSRSLRRDATPPERKLWYGFLAKHPQKFTRQKPVGGYIADFYCAGKQLVIELDGDTHYTAQGEAYDRTRTAALALSRIRVLRFTNADVMNEFDAVRTRIDEALSAATCFEPQKKP